MASDGSKKKRYNLVLPQELFDALQSAANERQITVVELLRRYIKLGLIADQVERSPDAALIIREGSQERQIIFL